jgi:multicomponent Na+:H+ antiporter subunit E
MKWLELLAFLAVEIGLGALRVAWLALQPKIRLRPALVAYPLVVTRDAQITLLANMITLTPGTLSVDVSDDRRTLYIHTLDTADAETLVGAVAAGFETRVLGVLKGSISPRISVSGCSASRCC